MLSVIFTNIFFAPSILTINKILPATAHVHLPAPRAPDVILSVSRAIASSNLDEMVVVEDTFEEDVLEDVVVQSVVILMFEMKFKEMMIVYSLHLFFHF